MTKKRLTFLRKDIKNAPRGMIENGEGNYPFITFSVGERGGILKPELITEVERGLSKIVKDLHKYKKFDRIIAPQPGGVPWALLIASKLKIPLSTVRENPTFYTDEEIVQHKTPLYRQRELHFTQIRPKEKVLIIDDIISTGSTTSVIINFLRSKKVKVSDVVCILTKGPSFLALESRCFVKVHSLLQLTSDGGFMSKREIEIYRNQIRRNIIYDCLLFYKDTGILISSVFRQQFPIDIQLYTAQLEVLQQWVRDTSKSEMKEYKNANHSMAIERGKFIVLAVSTKELEDIVTLRQKMKNFIEMIEKDFSEAISKKEVGIGDIDILLQRFASEDPTLFKKS